MDKAEAKNKLLVAALNLAKLEFSDSTTHYSAELEYWDDMLVLAACQLCEVTRREGSSETR